MHTTMKNLRRFRAPLLLACAALSAPPVDAQEPVDTAMARKIYEEATLRSRAMEYAFQLTDVRGPRLAGSPNFKAAALWALQALREMGLRNVRAEPITYGRSWSENRFEIRLVEPTIARLNAVAVPFSLPTPGEVVGPVVMAPMPRAAATAAEYDAYFAAHRGKLRGRFVLAHDTLRRPDERKTRWYGGRPTDDELRAFNERFDKMEDEEEKSAADSGKALSDPIGEARVANTRDIQQRRMNEFLRSEGVLGVLYQSQSFGGTVGMWTPVFARTQSAEGRRAGYPWPPAGAILMYEHYNRLARLVGRGVQVRVAMRIDSEEHRDSSAAFNVIGELPGTSKPEEVVLLGAHLDSWNAGTGATDDAAGVAVMMEAIRVLHAVGARPARTIRVGFWGAHESTGGLGIRTYIRDHLMAGYRADWRSDTIPPELQPRPDHAKLSAYYHLDMGPGRIRGIFLERNTAVRPIFEAWGKAYPQIGTFHLPNSTSYGTDTPKMTDVGIPGFQFVQDGVPSLVRSHHSSMDLLDFLHAEDLQSSAAVVALFAYQTAIRSELLPRANSRVAANAQ